MFIINRPLVVAAILFISSPDAIPSKLDSFEDSVEPYENKSNA